MITRPEEDASFDDRLSAELQRYVASIEPTDELRSSVGRLSRHSTTHRWSRWRGPLLGAAAVAAIAVLTSVVLYTGDHDTVPAAGDSSSIQPFAPEPTPRPELDDDPPIAVTYSEGAHGTPSDEFRIIGEAAAQALRDNNYQALAQLQDPSAQQPNTIAGLLSIYGGRPVRAVEYSESSISQFLWAAVDYSVTCPSGRAVRFSLRFNHINGRWALFVNQQEDLAVDASANAVTPSGDTPAAVPDTTPSVRPGTMVYPACSR